MNPPQIGQIIKEIRVKKNLTQEKLAIESGVTAANISKIENNRKNINLSTLNAILIALGMPPVERLIHEATMNGTEIKKLWDTLSPEKQARLKGFAECLMKE